MGGELPKIAARKLPFSRQRATLGGQNQTAFLAVFGVFFLTLFLAGQVVGTMAEERSNKVIEVLAAAVPLEAVFLGKLLGMFGVAVLFITFWGTVLGQVTSVLPPAFAGMVGELSPAVGLPMFTVLFVTYFTMAYLLLGSVFLTIGAQASTMREIQMLSLPITIVQVGMFTLTLSGLSQPGSWLALVAEVFPLSSPFAMAGVAAASNSLWPHAVAIAWQALWVALFVTLAPGCSGAVCCNRAARGPSGGARGVIAFPLQAMLGRGPSRQRWWRTRDVDPPLHHRADARRSPPHRRWGGSRGLLRFAWPSYLSSMTPFLPIAAISCR